MIKPYKQTRGTKSRKKFSCGIKKDIRRFTSIIQQAKTGKHINYFPVHVSNVNRKYFFFQLFENKHVCMFDIKQI